MKLLNIIIWLLILCSLVLATEYNIITFTTIEDVSLNALCLDPEGNSCTSIYQCYVSVYYPNWTINVTNEPMDFIWDGFYNVSIGTYTETGDYKGFIKCVTPLFDENNATDRADFRIVKETVKEQYEVSMRMIAITIMFIITGIFFFIMGAKNDKVPAKLFGYSMGFVELLMLVGVLYADYLGKDLTTLLYVNFSLILIIGFGLGIYTFFMTSVELIDVKGNDNLKWEKKWG